MLNGSSTNPTGKGMDGANPQQRVYGAKPKTLCWQNLRPIKQEGRQAIHSDFLRLLDFNTNISANFMA